VTFVEVASVDELRESGRKLVTLGEDKILLVFLDGKVYAISAVCPHRSGELIDGQLDDEEVICPMHAFMFNIKTGLCLNSPTYSIRSYKVKIEGDIIKMDIE